MGYGMGNTFDNREETGMDYHPDDDDAADAYIERLLAQEERAWRAYQASMNPDAYRRVMDEQP